MLYEFKINLEPAIINLYTQNGTVPEGMRQLKEILIPKLFDDLFQKIEKYSDHIIFLNNDISVEISKTKEYTTFDQTFNKLKNQYFAVLAAYEETGAISYSQEYLGTTKIDAKNAIVDLLHTFPELNLAQDFRNNEFSEDLNNKVGHGKSYIIHGRKIKKYLLQHPTSSKISAYYNSKTEKLYISAQSMEKATASCALLNKMMNGISKEHNLGRININPIFDEYKVENSYNRVTFHFVYPNGIQLKDSKDIFDKFKKYNEVSNLPASQVDLTITASESEKFSADSIEAVGEEDGKFGYLKSITNNANKVMKPVIRAYQEIKEVVFNEDEINKR